MNSTHDARDQARSNTPTLRLTPELAEQMRADGYSGETCALAEPYPVPAGLEVAGHVQPA